MRQFVHENFDKLLLALLYLILLSTVLHLAHWQADQSLVSWARDQAGIIVGALIGLITGFRAGRAEGVSSEIKRVADEKTSLAAIATTQVDGSGKG